MRTSKRKRFNAEDAEVSQRSRRRLRVLCTSFATAALKRLFLVSRQRLFEWGEGDDREHGGDPLDDKARGDGGSVVMQDRHEPSRVDVALVNQQRAQLR